MKILLLVALSSQEDVFIAPSSLTLTTPMAFKPPKLWGADDLLWKIEAFNSPSYLIRAAFPLIPCFVAPAQDHTFTSKRSRQTPCCESAFPFQLGKVNPPTSTGKSHPGRAGRMFLMFPVAWDRQKDVPDILCVWQSVPVACLGTRE